MVGECVWKIGRKPHWKTRSRVKTRKMSEKARWNTRSRVKTREMSEKALSENEKQGKNKKNEPKSPHYKLLSGVKLDKTEKYNYQRQNNRLQ